MLITICYFILYSIFFTNVRYMKKVDLLLRLFSKVWRQGRSQIHYFNCPMLKIYRHLAKKTEVEKLDWRVYTPETPAIDMRRLEEIINQNSSCQNSIVNVTLYKWKPIHQVKVPSNCAADNDEFERLVSRYFSLVIP